MRDRELTSTDTAGSFIRIVTGHPRRVLVAAVILFGVAGAVGGPVAGLLSPGGFEDPGSESQVAIRQVTAATHADPARTVVALVRPGGLVTGPAGRAEVVRVRDTLRSDPAVASVVDASTNPALVSRDGTSTYLVAELRPVSDKAAKDAGKSIERRFAGDRHVILGGAVIANLQVQDQVSADLARAEAIAAVALIPLLIIVFRGAVAALLPLTVGVLTILTTFLGLRIVNSATDLSIFALNLVTGLGLGLSIDYSLLITSRYREEAARLGHGVAAMRATLATAGRTVLFSSLTVAAAVASLLVFPQQFLYSMGTGGLIVALSGSLIALTVLPALILFLGPRIDALSFGRHTPATGERGGWYQLSHFVMRRPGTVAVATGALLLVMGVPFLGVRFTSVDASVLPTSASARQVNDAVHRDFAADTSTPITVTVSAPASAGPQVAQLAAEIRHLPAAAIVEPPRYAGSNTWIIGAVSSSPFLSDGSQQLVTGIRSLSGPGTVRVAGATASFIDLQSSLRAHLPLAIVIVAIVTVLVLFALTGSAILPLKALVMNALSLSAAFGLLVFIFQDGRLTGLLRYSSQGALESTQPILLFAIAFGLSTDYGVFLLTRIKEAHDSGMPTKEAVATGLEHTGRIVTAAAALFCVAIGAFATSGIVFIKELGVGTALAVIIDATVVRAFLVPSLMALLGHWNWWAPRPLRRLHTRLRLDRVEAARAIAGSRPAA